MPARTAPRSVVDRQELMRPQPQHRFTTATAPMNAYRLFTAQERSLRASARATACSTGISISRFHRRACAACWLHWVGYRGLAAAATTKVRYQPPIFLRAHFAPEQRQRSLIDPDQAQLMLCEQARDLLQTWFLTDFNDEIVRRIHP
jgi:hypothetical protein